MPTLNNILKELKNVPVDRLEDIYFIVRSLRASKKKSNRKGKEILTFAGSFQDMSENDYNEFRQLTKSTRKDLFGREINL